MDGIIISTLGGVTVRRISRLTAVLWGALLVVALASSAGLTRERVVFRLNWIPEGEGEHALFYVALDQGFYAENGLEVEIQRGSGSGDTVSRVSAGSVDIGYADTPTTLVAVGNGADLVLVGMVYQASPFTLWTRADTGIRSPRDLAGRTIGAPAGDAQRIMFPAFARAVGLDPNSVTWVNIAPAAKIQSLAARRVDATVHFIDQLALYRDAIGQDKLIYFWWPDFGVNPYGNALLVTRKTLRERPATVRAFLEATYRALRWTVVHPREAVETVRKYVPAAQPESLLSMLEQELKIMDSSEVRVHGLGWMDARRMAQTVELVESHFQLPNRISPGEVYTNELLPHYTWPYPNELGR